VISSNENIRSLQVSADTPTIVVNWYTEKKMSAVKFQKTCGACYSFTPIGAIESAYMIYKNTILNFAEQ
jgi:C1A family cysteine protease